LHVDRQALYELTPAFLHGASELPHAAGQLSSGAMARHTWHSPKANSQDANPSLLLAWQPFRQARRAFGESAARQLARQAA
jgi:hypothetical protein